jgi:hypothetical protein
MPDRFFQALGERQTLIALPVSTKLFPISPIIHEYHPLGKWNPGRCWGREKKDCR